MSPLTPEIAARFHPCHDGPTCWTRALALAKESIRITPAYGMKRAALGSQSGPMVCRCCETPCREGLPGLHPRTPGWRVSAATDFMTLAAWAHKHPEANALAVCGEASALIVIATDGPNGEHNLARWEEQVGELPRTSTATWEGHRQRWFRLPFGGLIPWSSHTVMAARLGEGVTILSEDSFAPVPGSVVGEGCVIQWGPSPSRVRMAMMPEPWLELLSPKGGAPRRIEAVAMPSVKVFARPG